MNPAFDRLRRSRSGDHWCCFNHAQLEKRARKEERLAEAARLQSKTLPADWTKKSEEWVFVGLILLQQQSPISNEELAERLDASGFKCRFSQDRKWGIITRKGYPANMISAIRDWVDRRGKTPRRKK